MGVAAVKQEAAEALLAAHGGGQFGAWAAETRADAAARLRRMGAPDRRDEYWRFTDPAPLVAVPAPHAATFDPGEAPVFDSVDALLLTFSDGAFRPDLSDPLDLEGIEIEPLSEAMAVDIHWARDVYGRLEAAGQDPVARPLAALNTATAQAGLVIRVTKTPAKPVALRYLHERTDSDAMIHHVIRVDPGQSFTLLETGPAAARFNKCLEVEIGDGAEFHHVRTQGRDHERRASTANFFRLGEKSLLKSFTLTVNGRLTRNESVIELTGNDASAHVAGAAVGWGDFHHDDTVFITHGAENCESRQVFKKVLRAGAVGVFQGKILVKEGAQKTDGYQISQGLLLDENAEFLAKPELEIYADDVACSHGSTVGAVDETALFYLTSRGVPRREAEDMLVLAFLDEAIAEIGDEGLAEEIRERLAAWAARRRA